MNRQVKARLNAVKDFLAGRSPEEKVAASEDKATREVVAAELLSAMARSSEEAAGEGANNAADRDSSGVRDGDSATKQGREAQEPGSESIAVATGTLSEEQIEAERLKNEEQERARKLFLEHGYFDEAVQNLRTGNAPAERAAAARALGVFGSQRGTAHLIAAMFDDDAEVRTAAEEALNQIGDPTLSSAPADAVSEVQEQILEGEAAANSIEVVSETNAASEMGETQPRTTSRRKKAPAQPPVATATAPSLPTASSEEEQLLLEENAVRETVVQLEQVLLNTAAVRKQAEQEVERRIEQEAQLRAAAAALRSEEEELRRRADEDAERRRVQELEAFKVEQEARGHAEAEAQRLATEEAGIRLKTAGLRAAAEELARQRTEMETGRRETAEAAQRAQAQRLRDEATARHQAELDLLRSQEEELQTATSEVALRVAQVQAAREDAANEIAGLKEELTAVEAAKHSEVERLRREAEARNASAEEKLLLKLEELRHADEEVAARRAQVEAAREHADVEAARLLEAQARMQAAEEARVQAEIERAEVEAQINERLAEQMRLLEQSRRRAQEEHDRMLAETQRQAEAEEKRLADLEVMRARAETESKQRGEKEREILSQIDSLRIGDAETRKRIEDAEVRRRAAEDAYRLVAEKVQRVEAEAHARAKEEEQTLARLEAERRTAAVAAQSRAEQEKRIREEIEMFRRLEEQERPRIEEAMLQRTQAEARLQDRQDQLRAEGERVGAAELLSEQLESYSVASDAAAPEHSPERSRPVPVASIEASRAFTNAIPDGEAEAIVSNGNIGKSPTISSEEVTPTIVAYLNSVDPYKRAAAVSELARSGSKDAFNLIAGCFDDHSPHVRNAAARALRKLEPAKTVDLFNRALEDASVERRRSIGNAIAASGMATEAIQNLVSENREDTYNALSILFVMAKTGEVEPLVQAIAEHKKDEIGRAVTKLLNLSGHAEIATAALNGKKP